MIQVGSYFPDRDARPLSAWESCTVDYFHDLYYRRWIGGGDIQNLSWFGYQMIKTPLDMWTYQELLVRRRPDVVIETGTFAGGSALFLATILDLLGHGRVITIDIADMPNRPTHPRLTYVKGSSVDPKIVSHIYEKFGSKRAMVILDSDHSADHVYNELVAYSPLVQPDDYLIVEDTNINGHPVYPNFGPGPMEAVDRFLAENNSFCVDKSCERFLMTINPGGYLRRMA
jgi:cephalosporin hydroxylase